MASEYERMNELNTRRLGGQEPKTAGGNNEEEETNFEPMEQIMARFSNFSSRSSLSGNDEDGEEDEFDSNGQVEGADPESNGADGNTEAGDTATRESAEKFIVEVTILEPEPVEVEFLTNQYWKKPLQYNIDDLDLSDFE